MWRLILLLSVALTGTSRAEIVITAAPSGEELSKDYQVTVAGHDVPVYRATSAQGGGEYSFATFDFGEPSVTVEVRTAKSLAKLKVQPAPLGMTAKVKDARLVMELRKPAKLSIEPEGRRGNLLIFANAIEKDVPKADARDVIFFGPGVHRPAGGRIELKTGQTLIVAGGAVVHAAVETKNAHDVRIAGRGIIDGSDWPWLKGPASAFCGFYRCENVKVEGVILRGAYAWTLPLFGCRNVSIDNIKIVGGRVQNDDGINPCNSSNVTINDCLIRTDDDCVALKGVIGHDRAPTSNINITNTQLWCDRARIMLLGHESQASRMGPIDVSDCLVLHYRMTPFLLEPGEEMPLENVTFRKIWVNAEGGKELTRLRPAVNQYMQDRVPGRIRDITFDDVTVEGAAAAGIDISGVDEKHTVSKVMLKNVKINGQPLKRAQVNIGPHASDVVVEP